MRFKKVKTASQEWLRYSPEVSKGQKAEVSDLYLKVDFFEKHGEVPEFLVLDVKLGVEAPAEEAAPPKVAAKAKTGTKVKVTAQEPEEEPQEESDEQPAAEATAVDEAEQESAKPPAETQEEKAAPKRSRKTPTADEIGVPVPQHLLRRRRAANPEGQATE